MTVQMGPLQGRMTRRAMQIRPSQGGAFDVKENQFLQISDMLGKQVAVMVAFNFHDHTEFASTAHTRAINHSLVLVKEHAIYSNRRNKMFTLFEDTVGPPAYLLAREADVTVLLAVKKKVVANFAYRPGELNDAAVRDIVKTLPKIISGKKS